MSNVHSGGSDSLILVQAWLADGSERRNPRVRTTRERDEHEEGDDEEELATIVTIVLFISISFLILLDRPK